MSRLFLRRISVVHWTSSGFARRASQGLVTDGGGREAMRLSVDDSVLHHQAISYLFEFDFGGET